MSDKVAEAETELALVKLEADDYAISAVEIRSFERAHRLSDAQDDRVRTLDRVRDDRFFAICGANMSIVQAVHDLEDSDVGLKIDALAERKRDAVERYLKTADIRVQWSVVSVPIEPDDLRRVGASEAKKVISEIETLRAKLASLDTRLQFRLVALTTNASFVISYFDGDKAGNYIRCRADT